MRVGAVGPGDDDDECNAIGPCGHHFLAQSAGNLPLAQANQGLAQELLQRLFGHIDRPPDRFQLGSILDTAQPRKLFFKRHELRVRRCRLQGAQLQDAHVQILYCDALAVQG